jgi:heme exporter protein B
VNAIFTLIKKEFTLELRRKSVISGIGLYLLSLIFICYLTFNLRINTITPANWSALFWLTIMFCMVNSVGKSFIGERKEITLYYFTLASASQIIISKIIYNAILAFVLSVTSYLLFIFFIGDVVQDQVIFLLTLLLTSISFSSALTLISAIASKANHSNILMAVLGFPIIVSILLLAIKITKNVLDGIDPSFSYDELINLFAINCILTALAYLLFPYIWRS